VRRALATLPWVEHDSIKMDFKKRELTFGFKDRASFDAEAVKAALEKEKFKDVELLAGPKDQENK
jgi:hypothetical protein